MFAYGKTLVFVPTILCIFFTEITHLPDIYIPFRSFIGKTAEDYLRGQDTSGDTSVEVITGKNTIVRDQFGRGDVFFKGDNADFKYGDFSGKPIQ